MKKENKIYKCNECGFRYRAEKLARECEEWCKKHNSCNLKITKYAIKEK